MINKNVFLRLLPLYMLVISVLVFGSFLLGKAITVATENSPVANRKCIVIDAGHGGVDGGAVSCTGVAESQINLEIAKKLNDLCHLIGLDTKMIRTSDCSVYTDGNSIASKKVSDLKERVRIINETPNAILISIHQNKYIESKYSGAQVFYTKTDGSYELAKEIQNTYKESINQNCNRKAKKVDGVYLMEHITCPGVLIECGFLSNPEEEALLRNSTYQQKMCCAIISACSQYLNANPVA